eukprot:scaffold1351_cov176-Amphora_coffeaeformis.AAC.10
MILLATLQVVRYYVRHESPTTRDRSDKFLSLACRIKKTSPPTQHDTKEEPVINRTSYQVREEEEKDDVPPKLRETFFASVKTTAMGRRRLVEPGAT